MSENVIYTIKNSVIADLGELYNYTKTTFCKNGEKGMKRKYAVYYITRAGLILADALCGTYCTATLDGVLLYNVQITLP